MQTALVALVLAQLALVSPHTGAGAQLQDATMMRCTIRGADASAGDSARTAHRATPDCASAVRPRAHFDDPPRNDHDPWLGVDKVQHFAMAYGTAMFGYGVLRGAGASHDNAKAAALAGSLAAGLGKELYDRARGGPFSLKDLAWDALGTLAAWSLLSLNR